MHQRCVLTTRASSSESTTSRGWILALIQLVQFHTKDSNGSSSQSSPEQQVLIALGFLVGVPIAILGNLSMFGNTLGEFWTVVQTVWDSLLRYDMRAAMIPVALAAFFVLGQPPEDPMTGRRQYKWLSRELRNSIYEACCESSRNRSETSLSIGSGSNCNSTPTNSSRWQQLLKQILYHFFTCPFGLALAVSLILCLIMYLTGNQQAIRPGWIWNPFLWFGNYKVYFPYDLVEPIEHVCFNHVNDKVDFKNPRHQTSPLCLEPDEWTLLSTGSLSSFNPVDVDTVFRGVQYARNEHAGLVVNVMARDVEKSIVALRQNVEALAPFFNDTIAVVIFENDSVDGTREAFEEWARDPTTKYKVDVMDCSNYGGTPDCHFDTAHRYDGEPKDYWFSSSVGELHKFRQYIFDYILENYALPLNKNDIKPGQQYYSHMLVVDMDLQISLSPLGLMHSLGHMPNNVVASSGREPWHGSLGSVVLPYDVNAFRAIPTPENSWIRGLHEYFCGLQPPGSRWRNFCEVLSSATMIQVLLGDRGREDFYPVASAFNGAALYPLQLLQQPPSIHQDTIPEERVSGGVPRIQYDRGQDTQRCEHIGFHMSIPSQMYVNRKWNLNLSPDHPAGPTGERSKKVMDGIMSSPLVVIWMAVQLIGSFVGLGFVSMTFTIHLFLPLIYYSYSHSLNDKTVMKPKVPSRSPSFNLLANPESLPSGKSVLLEKSV